MGCWATDDGIKEKHKWCNRAVGSVVKTWRGIFLNLGAGIWQNHYDDPRDIPFIPHDDPDRYNSAYHAFLIFWTYVILFQVKSYFCNTRTCCCKLYFCE